VDVSVTPQITLTAAAPQVAPGGVIQFTGTVSPAKAKLSAVVSQQQLDGTFTPARTINFNAATDGSFTRTIGFPAAGQYEVVVRTAGDALNAAGASPPAAVTVA
jgi:hypothetical protein